jgi:asparagine synthase (glutamine-hydrolysing)
VSGFAAVFRFDGAPAGRAALAAMTDAIAYRGPDGRSEWAKGPAAISHLTLRTTAESLEETQPLANEDATLVLVMDGWLANYDELRSDLLARGAVLRTRADAELVLRAYEAWGDDCPNHIDGEYAFAIWDARRREAFCAKDHAGLRPLHYHWDGKRLLVASDIAGVMMADDFERRPNKGMIAEHLANEWYSDDETLWADVMRLPPAHTMRIGAGGPKPQRYWTPPVDARIRYARDEDYQAHYRAIFEESVQRSSRTHLPLGCDVSGGHDSSAVFGVAHRLRREGRLLAPSVTGYTFLATRDCPPGDDEIEYARAVGAHLGVAIREVPTFVAAMDWYERRIQEEWDISTYPNVSMLTDMGKVLTAAGSRVSLNGHGGDEFLAVPPVGYSEHFAEADWRSFAASLYDDAQAFGWRRALWMGVRFGIGPTLAPALRALRRKARWGPKASPGRMLLTTEMLELLNERRDASHGRLSIAGSNAVQRGMLARVSDPFGYYMHEFLSRNTARLGYEARSPMYSRRSIEFALAIPDRQRRRGVRQKVVHLEALASDLPEIVANRRDKAGASHLFEQVLDNGTNNVLARMLQRGIDWMEPSGVLRLIDRFDRGPADSRPIYELWAAWGCRRLFESSASK